MSNANINSLLDPGIGKRSTHQRFTSPDENQIISPIVQASNRSSHRSGMQMNQSIVYNVDSSSVENNQTIDQVDDDIMVDDNSSQIAGPTQPGGPNSLPNFHGIWSSSSTSPDNIELFNQSAIELDTHVDSSSHIDRLIQNPSSRRSTPNESESGPTSKAILSGVASDTAADRRDRPVTGAPSSTDLDLANNSDPDSNDMDYGTQSTNLPNLSGITSNRRQGEGIRVEESSDINEEERGPRTPPNANSSRAPPTPSVISVFNQFA